MKSQQTLLDPAPAAGHSWYLAASVMMVAVTLFVAGYGAMHADDEKPVMSVPDGPSEVSGQTIMPEPASCPGCECRACESGTWLAQFVHHLDTISESPREIRDVLNRCYTETRLTPSVVSETGDWGICQINRRAWPDVDTDRLLDDPEYAAVECLRVYRVYFSACGKRWQDCYRRGVRGSK